MRLDTLGPIQTAETGSQSIVAADTGGENLQFSDDHFSQINPFKTIPALNPQTKTIAVAQVDFAAIRKRLAQASKATPIIAAFQAAEKAVFTGKITAENRDKKFQELYQKLVGLSKTIKPNGLSDAEKDGLVSIAHLLTDAKRYGLSEADTKKLHEDLAYFVNFYDKENDAKITSFYRHSEVFLEIADRYGQKLPKHGDRHQLFAAAIKNGLANQAGTSLKQREQGVSSTTSNLAAFISRTAAKLEPQRRAEMIKVAGVLMNYREPVDLVAKTVQDGTSTEKKTYSKFESVFEDKNTDGVSVLESFGPLKEASIKALLDLINEEQFDGSIDKELIKELTKLEDPLAIFDAKERKKLMTSIKTKLAKDAPDPAKRQAEIEASFAKLLSILEKPEILIN